MRYENYLSVVVGIIAMGIGVAIAVGVLGDYAYASSKKANLNLVVRHQVTKPHAPARADVAYHKDFASAWKSYFHNKYEHTTRWTGITPSKTYTCIAKMKCGARDTNDWWANKGENTQILYP